MEKNLDDTVVEYELGPLRSELAVWVDGEQVFSRLEKMRYPEARELIAICRQRQ